MPLHHFLPAAFIGNFSYDSNFEMRNRKLYVGDKETGKVFHAPASKVCGIHDLYSLENFPGDPQLVDSTWTHYEKKLPLALEQILNSSIGALTWGTVLVPFVVGLMVRGPNFNERFEKRIGELGVSSILNPDNTNFGRLFEYQRLLAPVMAAKWIVFKTSGEIPLITNDLGYAPFGSMQTNEIGIAIPINPNFILAIIPQSKNFLAISVGGKWKPLIYYYDLTHNNHIDLNRVTGVYARRFIFGPDSDVIKKFLQPNVDLPLVPEPYELGFLTGYFAMLHDMTWHKFISAVAEEPKWFSRLESKL